MENGKTILLVEDDKFISRAYRAGIGGEGFKVITAYTGVEGMAKAKRERPDLILLDLVMPMMDGFDLLKDLKKDPETKNIPVVILSNLGQESDIQKGKALGAADYLVKANWSMKDVIAKVKEHLGE